MLAVWKSYAAIYKHSTDSDSAHTAKHRAVYSGIKSVLEWKQFAHSLAVMLDALGAVSELWQALESESCSLAKAYELINRTLRHLKMQKEGTISEYYEKYWDCDGVFFGIVLKETGTYLNKNAFVQALIDNIKWRLSKNLLVSEDEFGMLLADIDVLDRNKWPSSGVLSRWPEGETKLKWLCRQFGISNTRAYLREFRDFIDNPETTRRLNYELEALVNTLAVTTADCERGFSTMNVICSTVRNAWFKLNYLFAINYYLKFIKMM